MHGWRQDIGISHRTVTLQVLVCKHSNRTGWPRLPTLPVRLSVVIQPAQPAPVSGDSRVLAPNLFVCLSASVVVG